MERKLLSIGQLLALVSGAVTVVAVLYASQNPVSLWGLVAIAFCVYMIDDPQKVDVSDPPDQWLPIKQGVAAIVGNAVLVVAAFLTKDPGVVLGLVLVGLVEWVFYLTEMDKKEEDLERRR